MKRLTALVLLALTLLSQAAAEEFGAIVRHGSREEKRLCITVDDCADSEMIRAIFELSRKEAIPLTFFTNGYTLKDEDRELWLSIAESDCEIGNQESLKFHLKTGFTEANRIICFVKEL